MLGMKSNRLMRVYFENREYGTNIESYVYEKDIVCDNNNVVEFN